MTTWNQWNAMRTHFWLRECMSVGNYPRLVGKPDIHVAEGEARIGHRFYLSSSPVASHLVAGPNAVLDIGNDVSIGGGAAIAAYQHISIGDGTQIGPFVIIMDTNFHGLAGDQSVQHDCRPVVIGKGCRIGSRVTISRGTVIGDGAEILAGSVVSSTIPPGACAAGARARIIGQAGDWASRWDSPAAALPDILMTSLELASPPDIDSNPLPTQQWTADHVRNLCDAIEKRIGVVLDPITTAQIRTFADLAAAVQRALPHSS